MAQASLASTIERAIEERAGLSGVVVEETDDAIVLSGRVDSTEARQAAADIAGELAAGKRLDNDLEVEDLLPVTVADFNAGGPSAGDLPETVTEIRRAGGEIDPDFTDQPVSTTGLEMSGVDTLEETGEPYFPPTDPVVTADERGDLEVLGGFSPTSTDTIEVAPSASGAAPGDEALADAIRRELREDALTIDLRIDVAVRNGVARLRGEVSALQDAENAEAVAGRVPGLRDIVEELTVREL